MPPPAFLPPLPFLLPPHPTLNPSKPQTYTSRPSTRCSLPPSYDHRDAGIPWKDRVALYAQFSPEETLDSLLQALRENSRTGPTKDDGIDALYAFANVDIWALSHSFFGRKMDLGQFERFKRVLVAAPYDMLLRHRRVRTLSALRIGEHAYVSRRSFEAPGRPATTFTFTLVRGEWGGQGRTAWMVDSIIVDLMEATDPR